MAPANKLFTRLRLGDITVPNRIFMSALTRDRATDTIPTDLMREYYVQRATAGLIVTEGVLITRQGTEWQEAPGIWSAEQVKAWKKIRTPFMLPEAICMPSFGTVMGRVSHPDAPQQLLAGGPVYGPSAISARGGKFRFLPGKPGYVTPTELPDPWVIIKQFKEAAVNAKAAGFDGVEMHGANGYLVAQFLDSTSNKRTDEWGGSVQNRARFGLEVLKVLKEVYGKNVSVKLSPAGGYNDVGMPLEETLETFRYFITEADKLGLSYITLVRYAESLDPVIDGNRRGTPHNVVESYRPHVKKSKVVINGGVLPEEGETLVSSGNADAVSVGFNYVTHPDVVARFKNGIPFNNPPNIGGLYGAGAADLQKGYTDYPAADPAETPTPSKGSRFSSIFKRFRSQI